MVILIAKAAYISSKMQGRRTANGDRFDSNAMTASTRVFPLGARVRVSVSDPDRSVIVTVTDRGPAHSLVREGRIIDLAQAAFEHLAPSSLGLVPVTVEPLR